MERRQTAQLLDRCVLVCHRLQDCYELEYHFRNILIQICWLVEMLANALALNFNRLRIRVYSPTQIALHKSIQIPFSGTRPQNASPSDSVLVSSDLFDLSTRASPLPPEFLCSHPPTVSYPLTGWCLTRDKEGSLQRTEQVTKKSNYVLQWSKTDETGAAEAPRYPDAYCTTQGRDDRHSCANRPTHRHKDTTCSVFY